MKTDRLLSEILLLMRRGRMTARQLAAQYEVSPRTILRDMESLCMAGVPVISFDGANGGFELPKDYRIGQNDADAALIVTAMQALSTAIKDEQLLSAMEKYRAVQGKASDLHIDLSALAEDARVQGHLASLRRAIRSRHAVRICYTNATGETAEHMVEPMELHYRWYTWYLHAYSRKKQAVLTYKLVRMDSVTETDEPIGEHSDAASPTDERPLVHLILRCRESARVPLIEYLHAQPQRQLDDGDWLMEITLPAGERFWRGALLSLGDAVEVLSPAEVIEEFTLLAQSIAQLYKSK